MRRILIAAVVALATAPAWAQTASEKMAAAECGSPHPAIAIKGCTALIQIPKQTDQILVFAYNDRAWAYHTLGKNQDALRDVNMALLLAPKNAAVIETRAEIYEKLKERDKAIVDYREALKLDPKMGEASAGLKRLGATP
jgi:Tfp pilus assembly protein PilF